MIFRCQLKGQWPVKMPIKSLDSSQVKLTNRLILPLSRPSMNSLPYLDSVVSRCHAKRLRQALRLRGHRPTDIASAAEGVFLPWHRHFFLCSKPADSLLTSEWPGIPRNVIRINRRIQFWSLFYNETPSILQQRSRVVNWLWCLQHDVEETRITLYRSFPSFCGSIRRIRLFIKSTMYDMEDNW